MTDNTTTVTRSFTTREAPWMKIGKQIEHDVDAAEAAKIGGLDFDVELRPAYFGNHGAVVNATTRRAMVRADTGEFFAFVSANYKPVQYREAFDFMDGVNPRYVAAGTLSDGRQGFMVAQLPTRPTTDLGDALDGVVDLHSMYVVLRTSHDLSKAIEVALVNLRHKCMNQLALPSLTRDAPQRWSVRHVGDPHAKLEQAQLVLTRADGYAVAFARQVRSLNARTVGDERAVEILHRVLPDRPGRPEQVRAILAARGSEFVGAEFRDTGWGLVQAVSEYFEWQRDTARRTDQSRFTSGLAGDTYRYVNRTAQLVQRAA